MREVKSAGTVSFGFRFTFVLFDSFCTYLVQKLAIRLFSQHRNTVLQLIKTLSFDSMLHATATSSQSYMLWKCYSANLSIFYFPMKLLHNMVLKGFYCHFYLVQLLIATCNQYGLIFNILSPDICTIFQSLTFLLTAWSRFLLEKPTGSQLFKKFPTF